MDFDYYGDIKQTNGLNVSENKLFEAMREIGLNPIPQYKISQMTVDFAFPDRKIVIEVNGPYHRTEEQIIRDKKRWFVLNKEGWKRRSFSSKEVYENPQRVAEKIKNLIEKEEFGQINFEETKTEYILSNYPRERKKTLKEVFKEILGVISISISLVFFLFFLFSIILFLSIADQTILILSIIYFIIGLVMFLFGKRMFK